MHHLANTVQLTIACEIKMQIAVLYYLKNVQSRTANQEKSHWRAETGTSNIAFSVNNKNCNCFIKTSHPFSLEAS